jgi:hypothetical protein
MGLGGNHDSQHFPPSMIQMSSLNSNRWISCWIFFGGRWFWLVGIQLATFSTLSLVLEGDVKFLAIDMIFLMSEMHSKFFVHGLWTLRGIGDEMQMHMDLMFTTIMCNFPDWSSSLWIKFFVSFWFLNLHFLNMLCFDWNTNLQN